MDQARDSRMRSTRRRDCEPPLPEPLAYFLTWPTNGTWLPGDERGWVEYRHGWQLPDPARKREAQARLTEDACLLDQDQRRLVELTIADHCRGARSQKAVGPGTSGSRKRPDFPGNLIVLRCTPDVDLTNRT